MGGDTFLLRLGNQSGNDELAVGKTVASIEFTNVRDNSNNNSSLIGSEGFIPDDLFICFTRDTCIETDQGDVLVQDMREGMLVRTLDNGFQPIRWIGHTKVRDRAVRIKKGVLGNQRDLVVSPRHRMFLKGPELELLFSCDKFLVTSQELINDTSVLLEPLKDVEYFHVMFDQHEIIYAEGAETESFHPDRPSIGSMDVSVREELLALFPEICNGVPRPQFAHTLPPLSSAYVSRNLEYFAASS